MGLTQSIPTPQQLTEDIARDIRIGRIELDACDVNKWVIDKLIGKFSASESHTIISDLIINKKALKVAVKMFYKHQENVGMISEVTLYRDVVSHLKDLNHTPHVVAFVAWAFCRDFTKNLNKIKDKKVREEVIKMLDSLGPTYEDAAKKKIPLVTGVAAHNLNVLMTEAVDPGLALKEFIYTKRAEIDPPRLRKIIFQTLWTLECFNRVGLRHNDLHLTNIMMEFHPTAQKGLKQFAYQLPNGDTIYLSNDEMVRIFDFDRGILWDTAKNKILLKNGILTKDFCKTYAQCNTWNPYADTYKFLFEILRRLLKYIIPSQPAASAQWNEMKDFIDWAISPKLRQMTIDAAKKYSQGDGPENALRIYGDTRDYIPKPDEMKTTAEMLQHGIFDPLKLHPPTAIDQTFTLPSNWGDMATQFNKIKDQVKKSKKLDEDMKKLQPLLDDVLKAAVFNKPSITPDELEAKKQELIQRLYSVYNGDVELMLMTEKVGVIPPPPMEPSPTQPSPNTLNKLSDDMMKKAGDLFDRDFMVIMEDLVDDHTIKAIVNEYNQKMGTTLTDLSKFYEYQNFKRMEVAQNVLEHVLLLPSPSLDDIAEQYKTYRVKVDLLNELRNNMLKFFQEMQNVVEFMNTKPATPKPPTPKIPTPHPPTPQPTPPQAGSPVSNKFQQLFMADFNQMVTMAMEEMIRLKIKVNKQAFEAQLNELLTTSIQNLGDQFMASIPPYTTVENMEKEYIEFVRQHKVFKTLLNKVLHIAQGFKKPSKHLGCATEDPLEISFVNKKFVTMADNK
jgi:hypothetical protein